MIPKLAVNRIPSIAARLYDRQLIKNSKQCGDDDDTSKRNQVRAAIGPFRQ